MPIPQSILDRIALFDRNEADCTSPEYKEARLRLEFLDPLFTALGWEVNNTSGNAEANKDVVKVGTETEAPFVSLKSDCLLDTWC